MTVLDLKGIAGLGGGIDISARAFTTLDLKGIAGVGKGKGAKLILRDANCLTVMDMKGIAGLSPGNVTFVL